MLGNQIGTALIRKSTQLASNCRQQAHGSRLATKYCWQIYRIGRSTEVIFDKPLFSNTYQVRIVTVVADDVLGLKARHERRLAQAAAVLLAKVGAKQHLQLAPGFLDIAMQLAKQHERLHLDALDAKILITPAFIAAHVINDTVLWIVSRYKPLATRHQGSWIFLCHAISSSFRSAGFTPRVMSNDS